MNSRLKKEIDDWLPIPVANLSSNARVPRSIIEAQLGHAVELLVRASEDSTCNKMKHDVITYQVTTAILGVCVLIAIAIILF